MKRFILFLLIIPYVVFCEEQTTAIFETYRDSIVYIEQTLYFNASDAKHPELFKRIEDHYKIKILDNYFTIASGSGFLITSAGHVISNHHVVDITDLKKRREDVLWGYLDAISRDMPDNSFKASEFELLISDFKVLFNKSAFYHRVTVKNKDHYIPESIHSDASIDLALLKISGTESFTAIPVGDSDMLKVGNNVIALGYPLQTTLDMFVKIKDLQSTLTAGNISAIRNENWGIQHTALINFGNSGGPLINMEGKIIGVNVAKVGSTIFFAIPSKKLVSWLNETKNEKIVEQNRSTAFSFSSSEMSGTSMTSKKGTLETGKSLFIKLEKAYKVLINNEEKGTTPILLNDLTQGEYYLTIESETEFHGVQLVVNPVRTDIVTYTPVMGKFTGNVFIESVPSGAMVFIDDKKMGTTPLALSDLTVEKHSLKLVLSGYLLYMEDFVIIKKDTIKLAPLLEKTYRIKFQDPLPENTVIKIADEAGEKTYSGEDTIFVTKGKKTIVITNKYFNDATFTYEIDADKTISFAPDYYRSPLRFPNLKPESHVLLNNIDVTDQINNLTIDARAGKHIVRIKTDRFRDYCTDIEVIKDTELSVTIIYKNSPDIEGARYAWIGYPLLGAGVLTAVGGFILNLDSIAMELTDNYSDYATLKWASFAIFSTGIAIIIPGIIFAYLSVGKFSRVQTDTEIWEHNISFSIDFRDDRPMLVFHVLLKD